MADKRITELNITTDPQASDVFALVNSGETKKVTYGTIRDTIHTTYDTGSLMTTGSLSGTTLTFEKGDSSTFSIDLSDTFITPANTGSFVESAYISLFSSASQNLVASGSEQVVTFTSVWASQGISLENNNTIRFAKAGTYQFNFVAQIANPENAVYDAWFWVKYNGSNFPNSGTQMTLQPRKNINLPSAQLMTINIVGVAQNDNDYIQLYWTSENNNVLLKEDAAHGPIPEIPSIIADVIRVG